MRRTDIVAVIAEVARAHVARWLQAGRIEVLPATQELALEIIVRLIGVPPRNLAVWGQQYRRYMLSLLPSRLPTPTHWWARRARRWLVREIVAELRAAGDDTTLVGGIANARDEHGALPARTTPAGSRRRPGGCGRGLGGPARSRCGADGQAELLALGGSVGGGAGAVG